MNVGIVDSVITEYEYALLRKFFEIDRTPFEIAMEVSALSQMWVYGLYEVLRMWRGRMFEFNKLYKTGGINSKLASMQGDDIINLTIKSRKRQLTRYRDDDNYRKSIDKTWGGIEPIYRKVELFRMNLAKHCAPGKDGVLSRAPGYGRINKWCGSMDYELVDKYNNYNTMNRRDIADALREYLVCVI